MSKIRFSDSFSCLVKDAEKLSVQQHHSDCCSFDDRRRLITLTITDSRWSLTAAWTIVTRYTPSVTVFQRSALCRWRSACGGRSYRITRLSIVMMLLNSDSSKDTNSSMGAANDSAVHCKLLNRCFRRFPRPAFCCLAWRQQHLTSHCGNVVARKLWLKQKDVHRQKNITIKRKVFGRKSSANLSPFFWGGL